MIIPNVSISSAGVTHLQSPSFSKMATRVQKVMLQPIVRPPKLEQSSLPNFILPLPCTSLSLSFFWLFSISFSDFYNK